MRVLRRRVKSARGGRTFKLFDEEGEDIGRYDAWVRALWVLGLSEAFRWVFMCTIWVRGMGAALGFVVLGRSLLSQDRAVYGILRAIV